MRTKALIYTCLEVTGIMLLILASTFAYVNYKLYGMNMSYIVAVIGSLFLLFKNIIIMGGRE